MVPPLMESQPSSHPFLEELKARRLFHQSTGEADLALALSGGLTLYCGFDPTKDSLTIGNLVALTLLRRFQLAGHTPIVLMGGGTGLIGDPSGKEAERQLNTREQIAANLEGQRPIFERFLDFDGKNAATIVNNAEWLEKLGFLEVLRDVGKHFSVNAMIQRDSVRLRLEGRDQGISYTEFSYMLLQAYDYAHLASSRDVRLQIGGSDQWGNIVAGIDLTRRIHRREVFGLTAPLLTKADGGKFGKTESGAVWLTRKYTSPYAFYQFFINAGDDDVENFLRVFSFRPLAELEALFLAHRENPAARAAQKSLAEEMTRLLHGEEGLREAESATEALFSGDVRSLAEPLLLDVAAAMPRGFVSDEPLGVGLSIVDALVESEAVKSKREARQFLESGAITLNGAKVDATYILRSEDFLFGRVALVRRGKKNWHVLGLRSRFS